MKFSLTRAAALLALACIAPAAEFKGWISDSTCGAGNAGSNQSARECAERCIKNGAAPVFVTEKDQNVYKISNANLAQKHMKGKVQISGEVKGDTIVIAKIMDIKD